MKGKIHIDDFAFRIQRRIEQIAQHEDNQYIGCRREVVEDLIILTPQLSENGEIKEYGGLVFFTSEERVAIVNQAQGIVHALLAALVREQRQPEYFSDGLEFVDIDYDFEDVYVYTDRDGVQIGVSSFAEELALYRRRFLEDRDLSESLLYDLVGKIVGLHIDGDEYVSGGGLDGVFITNDVVLYRKVSKVKISDQTSWQGIEIEFEFTEPISLVPVDIANLNLNKAAEEYNVCLRSFWAGSKIYPDDVPQKHVPWFRLFLTPDILYFPEKSSAYDVNFYMTVDGNRLGYVP